MAVQTISPVDALREQEKGACEIIDVRTPVEFREVHARGARLVPLDALDATSVASQRPVYFICKSGGRAAKACEKLAAAGLTNVYSIAGGTEAWEKAGLPVLRGKCISLERQVRIAAGSLVVIGVALGALMNPWLYGLAAFVGCGLVFAGITNTCGMGMMLAKMPWNRVDAKGCGETCHSESSLSAASRAE
jgi:rhodanese-related sulfurtransferase